MDVLTVENGVLALGEPTIWCNPAKQRSVVRHIKEIAEAIPSIAVRFTVIQSCGQFADPSFGVRQLNWRVFCVILVERLASHGIHEIDCPACG